MTVSLSRQQAIRLALGAQGFRGSSTVQPADGRALLRTVRRLGVVQIDSVNVLCRAHYMPLFSRLGNYDRDQLDGFNQGPPSRRRLFEYWGHEASLIPIEDYPLYRWRMARAREGGGGLWGRLKRFSQAHPEFIEQMLSQIERAGPLAASELAGGGRSKGSWWGWSEGKTALEYLFWSGRILVAHRRNNFERVYDLPERVVGRSLYEQTPPRTDDAQRALVERAAGAMGVATRHDLQRYFRLGAGETRARIDELVEQRLLEPVSVEGWRSEAWRHVRARPASMAGQQALLAPFDPMMWDRDRASRLFDFHYRIEIYTPAAQRRHGYYVLPFLHDGQLVARLDLRADRMRSLLEVIAAHPEPGVDIEAIGAALGMELERLAHFLGLNGVSLRGQSPLDMAIRGGNGVQPGTG
ncbi:winged helix-turn-helix domain-containing protein [Kushneria phosphatilytica]|uniref:Winged helix-turn-helix domain-containing protein n=1 Tax=Kushneria phosphatilytica TaxID=657387 RepID=A0A1S1NZ74_9GAMM|nr:crosslink repair DNA glycosylase YcaQ family protein [Kushneria phosphatilytica]OHV12173.1 hypothetical protein BH688_05855 [Kushneria phosphatilytica]QEL11367.1 winged helix-turn-helix domain-containing protein [Kushneria phosphatilytica]